MSNIHGRRAAFACLVLLLTANSGSGAGRMALDWLPPTRNTDDSALVDLAGYRLYAFRYGSLLPRIIQVRNPGLSSYVIDDLPSGNWVFYATAINRAGRESEPSNVIRRRIR